MKELEERKKELEDVALNMQYCTNGGIIYKLINDNALNDAISKLDDEPVNLHSSSLIKKGYLTANEQFIDMLNNFIHYLDFDLAILGSKKEAIIKALFENDTPEFVLCKKDWGDNNFIPYFTYNIRKFIVTGFFNTVKRLYAIKPDFFRQLSISDKLDLTSEDDVNKLYDLIVKISWCNLNEFGLYYIYLDINKYDPIRSKNTTDKEFNDRINDYYFMHFDRLIENYMAKRDKLSDFLGK